jgi:hypothetical protein
MFSRRVLVHYTKIGFDQFLRIRPPVTAHKLTWSLKWELLRLFCKIILKKWEGNLCIYTNLFPTLCKTNSFNVIKYFGHKPKPPLASYSRWHMQCVRQLSAVKGVLISLNAQFGIMTNFVKHGDQPLKSTEFWEFTD